MAAVAERVPPLQQDAVGTAATTWLASVAATVQVTISLDEVLSGGTKFCWLIFRGTRRANIQRFCIYYLISSLIFIYLYTCIFSAFV